MRNGNLDPIASLSRRERRAWRRRERAVVTAHQADMAATLDALAGTQVLAVTTGRTGTVTITLPGWDVGLAGVGASARAALAGLSTEEACRLTGGGRYGRFWWLSVGSAGGPSVPPVVVLGAAVRLQPAGGLTTPAPRKEYSLR